MQQKYKLGTRFTYFCHKNEKKISLSFIFCIRALTFSTHIPRLLIIKICVTNKVNGICGGGQFLVSKSQGSSSSVLCVRVSSPRIPSPRSQGPGIPVQSAQSQVLIFEYSLKIVQNEKQPSNVFLTKQNGKFTQPNKKAVLPHSKCT